MKIVIFAGGTGSENLQKGLYEQFHKSTLDYTIITNLYDNGKSTGLCRSAMDGEILGPSDLRKNQLLRHQLEHGDTKLYEFLEERITMATHEVEDYLSDIIANNLSLTVIARNILQIGIRAFFNRCKSPIQFTDFSVANIIYTGLAAKYSMSEAAKMMARVLDIPEDAVICNDDTSLFLKCKTESDFIIEDEGLLVEWNNPNDKVVSYYLEDKNGNSKIPVLSDDCKNKMLEADIIIFSSGTQWSSLLPTYGSKGFKETLSVCRAKKYIVLNTSQDKDIKGVSGISLLLQIQQHLGIPSVECIPVISSSAEENIRIAVDDIDKLRSKYSHVIYENISNGPKHHPTKLVKAIFKDYFNFDKIETNSPLVFDFDDTIYSRDTEDEELSKENCSLLQQIQKSRSIYICTGNDINHLLGKFKFPIGVFADGGVNYYTIEEYSKHLQQCLDSTMLFSEAEKTHYINMLYACGIPAEKIHDRNSSIIVIRPIDKAYRTSIYILISTVLTWDSRIKVLATGRSTVEISKAELSKQVIMDKYFKSGRITYIGDEHDGNDAPLFNNDRVDYITISSAKDTNMLLRIIQS